jgi:hypothetical protein
MSLGEDRIRIDCMPGVSSLVSQIKRKSAELIDLIQSMPKPDDLAKHGEFARLCALANTHYEDAAMWAVKAATV